MVLSARSSGVDLGCVCVGLCLGLCSRVGRHAIVNLTYAAAIGVCSRTVHGSLTLGNAPLPAAIVRYRPCPGTCACIEGTSLSRSTVYLLRRCSVEIGDVEPDTLSGTARDVIRHAAAQKTVLLDPR
eukprot:2652274-Rhodomonas_salina.4